MRFTADVKGGLHQQYSGSLGSINPGIDDQSTRRIAQRLDTKGELALRKIVDVLLGAAPGALAQATYPDIQASPELGGIRPVVNTTLINRVTTASDVTDVKAALLTVMLGSHSETPPYNGDRNPLGTR